MCRNETMDTARMIDSHHDVDGHQQCRHCHRRECSLLEGFIRRLGGSRRRRQRSARPMPRRSKAARTILVCLAVFDSLGVESLPFEQLSALTGVQVTRLTTVLQELQKESHSVDRDGLVDINSDTATVRITSDGLSVASQLEDSKGYRLFLPPLNNRQAQQLLSKRGCRMTTDMRAMFDYLVAICSDGASKHLRRDVLNAVTGNDHVYYKPLESLVAAGIVVESVERLSSSSGTTRMLQLADCCFPFGRPIDDNETSTVVVTTSNASSRMASRASPTTIALETLAQIRANAISYWQLYLLKDWRAVDLQSISDDMRCNDNDDANKPISGFDLLDNRFCNMTVRWGPTAFASVVVDEETVRINHRLMTFEADDEEDQEDGSSGEKDDDWHDTLLFLENDVFDNIVPPVCAVPEDYLDIVDGLFKLAPFHNIVEAYTNDDELTLYPAIVNEKEVPGCRRVKVRRATWIPPEFAGPLLASTDSMKPREMVLIVDEIRRERGIAFDEFQSFVEWLCVVATEGGIDFVGHDYPPERLNDERLRQAVKGVVEKDLPGLAQRWSGRRINAR